LADAARLLMMRLASDVTDRVFDPSFSTGEMDRQRGARFWPNR